MRESAAAWMPLSGRTLSDREPESLTEFFQALSHVRSSRVPDREAFPRTRNEVEGSIRRLKTRSRRISGCKNWNASLLRDGRSVAYDEWWEHDAPGSSNASIARHEQRTGFRFRHRRQAVLASFDGIVPTGRAHRPHCGQLRRPA